MLDRAVVAQVNRGNHGVIIPTFRQMETDRRGFVIGDAHGAVSTISKPSRSRMTWAIDIGGLSSLSTAVVLATPDVRLISP